MKEVMVKIPENRFDFFMELVRQLGIEATPHETIPKAHQAIVRERIKASDEMPEKLLDWEEIQDKFNRAGDKT
jgi:hypothetical protein